MTEFTITFHGPFHVGSGVPSQGLDRVLDRGALLPGTSLKGVMRAAAASKALGLPTALVARVFGGVFQDNGMTRRLSSPWAWSDVELSDDPSFQNLARIRINDETRTTERGFLMLGESVWATSARFTVTQYDELIGEMKDHLLALRASARAVTAIGGGRRRGEGWVTITDGTEWTAQDTQDLRSLRGER